ncbi:MAG: DUF1080 domain-containing protein [Planctomycetota bacterium]|nr:MAG: DUF1080 domain-containing protein [Planctomycetota bacterium]
MSEKIAPPRFGHGLGVGDINGDGRPDILMAKGWLEQPDTAAGNRRWRLHQVEFSNAYGGADMHVCDVDGDGDADVITSEAAHDFGLSWYEQLAEDQFERHPIVGSPPSHNRYGVLFTEMHSVAVADIDSDGLPDIVTGKTYWSHHRQSPMWDAGAVVYWFKLVRTPSGVDWLPFLINGETGIGRQVTVADIDGDGRLDVATGGMLGGNVHLQRRRLVSQEELADWLPKPYDGERLPPADMSIRLRGGRLALDADGRVPQAIEGEQLNATTTAGTAGPQPMGGFAADRWSGNSQLWWRGAKPGDRLELELDCLQPVEAVELGLTCARDYGIVALSIDGHPLAAPIDLYEPEVVSSGALDFPVSLPPGRHRLVVEIVGANPRAVPAYMFGLDYLRFRPAGGSFPDPANDEILPRTAEGRAINLDFETGDLRDWTATGDAFDGQPIAGDTVALRRSDMRSRHVGRYWIGGFEVKGDQPQGTLTSIPFRVTHRFASFYVGGGSGAGTRVELVAVGDEEPLYVVTGSNTEELQRKVVDLRRIEGREMVIRLVDASSGGWGHINFDHFRFHARRPGPVTPTAIPLVDDAYPHRGLSADAAAAAMRVPDGFEVKVCAAEPDVRQPIAMALDDRGRMWVAEAYEYPRRASGDRGRDRILVFEDSDGDDRFDRRTVFYEGLNLVSGLEVGFGGVWVGAAPYLMFIPDRDGDDVPDGQPQILLDGWGYQDTHETLNAFCWGPDGWLYGCHGVFTHSRVGKPGTPEEDRVPLNAAIWRYHPIDHRFEVFAHGTSNPWGIDFNEVGDAFATACVIPHLYHIIPAGRYQRQAGQHFNPFTYDDIKTIADHLHYLGATPHSGNGKSDAAGGGHAHAGAMVYLGGTWPAKYRGALLMNNIHGQRLNMDLLEASGSGYVGTHGPDFLLTGDMASQILNLRYGPDGNVYMIDWYDMQACHRPEVEIHDRSNGRIYKINYTGTAGQEVASVDLAALSDLELAELCLAENDWYVRHARRLLQERAGQGGVAQQAADRLRDIARQHADPTRRLRGMWALHGIGLLDASMLRRLMEDANPHVRSWAVRLAMQSADSEVEPWIDVWTNMAQHDPSPIVRLSLASVAGRIPPAQRWNLLAALVQHPQDAADHNLPLMMWYAMEPLADVDGDRALALGMQAGQSIPILRSFMLRRVAAGGSDAALQRLVRALGQADSPHLQHTFLDAILAALTGRRSVPAPSTWASVYDKLANSDDGSVRRKAAMLASRFGDVDAQQILLQTLQDRQAPAADRRQALEALLVSRPEGLAETITALLGEPGTPDELLPALVQGLGQLDAQDFPDIVLQRYESWGTDARRAALAALASRPSWASRLVAAIESGHIPSRDVSADLARRIEYLGDARLTARLEKAWGTLQRSSKEKKALIDHYKELVGRTDLPDPDPALGRTLFAQTCGRCHVLYGVGQHIGPDLTGSNRSNLDYLLENIVDPSAVMAKEYRPEIILTEDGQVVTGLLQEETSHAVVLQSAESRIVLPRSEIVQRKTSPTSMMPDNQLQPFSDHEIRSLIHYLRGTEQVPLLAVPGSDATLFNGQNLQGWHGNPALWTVEKGEIVGRSPGLPNNEFLVGEVEAANFRLSVDVRLIDDRGNSGIQFRSRVRPDGAVEGYQADIGPGWWGKLYEEHGRGLLWKASGEAHVRPGQWNEYTIEAVGPRIRTWINGQLCVDLTDPAGSRRGIFALQLHAGEPMEVRFRNFRFQALPAADRPAAAP